MKRKTKRCSQCNKRKPITAFYYHRTRKYYMNDCKECNKKRSTKFQKHYRKQNLNYVFYQRAYGITRTARYKKINVMNKPDLIEYLKELWLKQNKRCYYTRKEMSLTGYADKNKYAMTVDRKDPRKGYTKNNIVLCISLVNRMKQDLQYRDLLKWCRYLLQVSQQKGVQ